MDLRSGYMRALILLTSAKLIVLAAKCATFQIDKDSIETININIITLKFRILNQCAANNLRHLIIAKTSGEKVDTLICQIHLSIYTGTCYNAGNCTCDNEGTFTVRKDEVSEYGEVWRLEGVLLNGEMFEKNITIPATRTETSSQIPVFSTATAGTVIKTSEDMWTHESIIKMSTEAREGDPLVLATTGTTDTHLPPPEESSKWTEDQGSRKTSLPNHWEKTAGHLTTETNTKYDDVVRVSTAETVFATHNNAQSADTSASQIGVLNVAAISGGLFVLIITIVCLLHCRLMTKINSQQGRQLIASIKPETEVTRRRSRMAQFRSSTLIAARLLVKSDYPQARESRIYQEISAGTTDQTAYEIPRCQTEL